MAGEGGTSSFSSTLSGTFSSRSQSLAIVSPTIAKALIYLCHGPLHPYAIALRSHPLHNYPGNCHVIDCIACFQEALALFNKQLQYAPHVVGEKEEEHIEAKGEGWSLGREVGGRLERVQRGVCNEGSRVYTC